MASDIWKQLIQRGYLKKSVTARVDETKLVLKNVFRIVNVKFGLHSFYTWSAVDK